MTTQITQLATYLPGCISPVYARGPEPEAPTSYEIDRAVERMDVVWLAQHLRWALDQADSATPPAVTEATADLVKSVRDVADIADKVRAAVATDEALRKMRADIEDRINPDNADWMIPLRDASESTSLALDELGGLQDDLDCVVSALGALDEAENPKPKAPPPAVQKAPVEPKRGRK